ncbi:hypothetical protein, partial [Corynebacterium sp. HMSC30G07]
PRKAHILSLNPRVMGLRDIIKIKADTEVPASKGTVNLTVRLLLRCRTIDSGLTHYIKHLTDIDGYADSMSLGEPLNKGIITNTLPQRRFSSYIDAAQQSVVDPEALYVWGIRMAGAIQEALGVTEIYLRNAIDESLKNSPDGNRQWIANYRLVPHLNQLLDSRGNPYFRERTLKDQVRRNRRGYSSSTSRNAITHDDLVAQTSFGSWALLLPDRWERNAQRKRAREELWRSCLHSAFPCQIRTASRRSSVGETVGEYTRIAVHLRNRANHIDSLLNIDVLEAFNKFIVPLISSIGAEENDVLISVERIEATWHLRPCQLSTPKYDLQLATRS